MDLVFWVYILKCSDESFYVGHTDNMEARLWQHTEGVIKGCYTFNKRPIELVFCQAIASRQEAIERERQIKGWGRRKKLALIESRWDDLVEFSKSYSRG